MLIHGYKLRFVVEGDSFEYSLFLKVLSEKIGGVFRLAWLV
jgi:hypothetical protein